MSSIFVWEVNYDTVPLTDNKITDLERSGYVCPSYLKNTLTRENWYKRRFAVRQILKYDDLTDFFLYSKPGQKPILIGKNKNCCGFISISHSLKHFSISISLDVKIGIDTEALKNISISQAILKILCHEDDLFLFEGLTISEQQHMFYRVWTLKEAYLKMLGMGLLEEMNAIKVFDIETKYRQHQWIGENRTTTLCYQSDRLHDYAIFTEGSINWE